MLSQAKYQSLVYSTRRKVLGVTAGLWSSMRSYRDADVDRFVSRVVPVVQAGQLHVANVTNAYHAEKLGVASVVDRDLILGARGVDPGVVYRRPAVATYTALAGGKPLQAAVAEGAARLWHLAAMDMQLAKTHQAREVFSRSTREYYRRVLTGRENCALCVIASTQRYRRADLLPIHPGCDCDVDVIPKGTANVEPVLDERLLEDTYTEIATRLDHARVGRDARDLGLNKTDSRGRTISDYTDLIVTRDHSEYGPTLAWRSEKFTSAADIAALR